MYKFESTAFKDVPSMINYSYNQSLIIQSSSGAMLKTPIKNAEEFRHSDICLKAKLGSGNFGDVYQGDFIFAYLLKREGAEFVLWHSVKKNVRKNL